MVVCLLTQPSPTWKCANVVRDCILSHYWYYRGTCCLQLDAALMLPVSFGVIPDLLCRMRNCFQPGSVTPHPPPPPFFFFFFCLRVSLIFIPIHSLKLRQPFLPDFFFSVLNSQHRCLFTLFSALFLFFLFEIVYLLKPLKQL